MTWKPTQLAVMRTDGPDEQPVTVPDIQRHVRVNDADEEVDWFLDQICAATDLLQTMAGKQFVTATYELKRDGFPTRSWLELPHPPLLAVSSVAYTDIAGDAQTWASSNYDVDTHHVPGRIVLVHNGSWPSARSHWDSVTVTYTAGYGAASAVPDAIKHAYRLLIGHWYWNREAVGRVPNEIAFTVNALIDSVGIIEIV